MQDDFQKVIEDNRRYKQKFKEQEETLNQLKKVNMQTQEEFDAFKAEMQTKNSLIMQLKEQITEITEEQKKQGEREAAQ